MLKEANKPKPRNQPNERLKNQADLEEESVEEDGNPCS